MMWIVRHFVRDFNIQLLRNFSALVNELGDESVSVWSMVMNHHIAEAIFKGFARAMDLATMIEPIKRCGSIYKRYSFRISIIMPCKTKCIGIVDYGTGNLKSVENAFIQLGAEARIIKSPDALSEVNCLVFPGQGTFDQCMIDLESSGFSMQ